ILCDFIRASPFREWIGKFGPFLNVHSRFPRDKTRIEASLYFVLIQVGADEDDLLPAVAIHIAPVFLERLPPERIVRPSVCRDIRPPESQAFGSDDRARLAQLTEPLWACRNPEMSLGANYAWPAFFQEMVKLRGVERPSRAKGEVLGGGFVGFR